VAYLNGFYNDLYRGEMNSRFRKASSKEVINMIDLSQPKIQQLFFEQIKALNKR